MRLHGVAWSASAQNMPAPLLEGSVGEAGDLFAGQRGAGSGCWRGQYWTVLKGSASRSLLSKQNVLCIIPAYQFP